MTNGGGNGNFDEVTNDTKVTSMKFGVNILDDMLILVIVYIFKI